MTISIGTTSPSLWHTTPNVMYSPKIAEDLIPLLYAEAKKRKMHMTELVEYLLREALDRLEREPV